MKRIDLAKWCTFAVVGTILVLVIGAYAIVSAALPRRSGEARVDGLAAPLTIELDRHAIPRIRGSSFADALRGEGYMHAQERFFQMDLLRRSAAGELAALLGPRAAALDAAQAPFDLRARARELLPRLPAEHRAWLTAYTEGVNAGLADLGARPPEYWLFGAAPDPWREEDSLLVVWGLYTRLSNNEWYEQGQGVLYETAPAALYEFLTPSTSRFDRPLTAPAGDATGGYAPLPIPGPEVIDLRSTQWPSSLVPSRVTPPLMGPASNQWALAASRTARGDAILANDPHLDLRLPNTFYRAELAWPDGAARGASIPGLPGILIGASDTLAWGATVSNADQSDWVVVEVDPADPTRYLTPDGSEPFGTVTHRIEVAGGAPQPVAVTTTRWGPVTARDWRGRPLALHAAWLEPGGLNLEVVALASARDAAEGAQIVARWAGPSLNWMLADSGGHIGWAVNGPLPRREGFDGSRPTSWADGRGWRGELERPTLLGHGDGALYTANNRTLARPASDELSRVWMTPLRANRIAELLEGRTQLAEADSLAMQLDTRAAAYDRIRDIVLEVVPSDDAEPLLAHARAQVLAWNGRADVDQAGFRILHVYYRALLARALAPLLEKAVAADPQFVFRWPLVDEPLRRLLEERPPHLLTRGFADWPTFLRQVLLDALRDLEADSARPKADAAWGEVNRLAVAHPFAGLPVIGPVLGRWLTLPAAPLPGAPVTLRVATPNYGALLRMSVSPAHPEDGIFELAGGQSGHFLSANFADLVDDWVEGKPTPFLAGATVSRIVLEPSRQN
ncbi:MAG TPA: penicillin acylase family protein [Gammaproteobacteria bacterium]|nr:penicillin acylase family protein [Gammaproteobacteria bacterium]